MKSYEEIAASALERGRGYETRQRAKRRTAGRVCLCSVIAAALVAAGAWQAGALDARFDAVEYMGAAEPAIPGAPEDSAAPPVSPDKGDVPDGSANAPSEPAIPAAPPVSPDGGDVPDASTNSPEEPSSGAQNDPGVPDDGANGAIGYPAMMVDGNGNVGAYDYTPVISSYDGASSESACYAAPKNGKIFFSIPLNGAMEEYGDTVLYYVWIDVFSNGELLNPSSTEVKGIWEELGAQGLTACYEDYFDGQEHQYTLALQAKYDELRELTPPDGYGFFLYLRYEQ